MAGPTPMSARAAAIIRSCRPSVPFTPVPGKRLLVRAGEGQIEREALLLQAAMQVTDRLGVSVLHITFLTREEWELAGELGFLQRTDQQFHWRNEGYAQLRRFSCRARLAQAQGHAARSGAQALEDGIDDRMGDRERSHRGPSGTPSSPSTWTPARANGARPISRAQCFSLLGETHGRQDAARARQAGGPLYRRRAQLHRRRHALRPLLGRASRSTPSCISRSATTRRSTSPSSTGSPASRPARKARTSSPAAICRCETYSAHYIADPGLRRAVADYLKRERRAVGREIALLTEEAPFRRFSS